MPHPSDKCKTCDVAYQVCLAVQKGSSHRSHLWQSTPGKLRRKLRTPASALYRISIEPLTIGGYPR